MNKTLTKSIVAISVLALKADVEEIQVSRSSAPIPPGQNKLFTYFFASNSWLVILKAAGVGHTRFHDLRTAMSFWMKAAGVSSDIPSKIFGHSCPAITYRHYTGFDVEVMRDAINRLPL